jgi:hypothetical protein
MNDPSFLTPEMLASLINNGLGGLAIVLLLQVNARLGRIASIASDHERRLQTLERRAGVESPAQLPLL